MRDILADKWRCWSPLKPHVRSVETAKRCETARTIFAKRENVPEWTVRVSAISNAVAEVAQAHESPLARVRRAAPRNVEIRRSP